MDRDPPAGAAAGVAPTGRVPVSAVGRHRAGAVQHPDVQPDAAACAAAAVPGGPVGPVGRQRTVQCECPEHVQVNPASPAAANTAGENAAATAHVHRGLDQPVRLAAQEGDAVSTVTAVGAPAGARRPA